MSYSGGGPDPFRFLHQHGHHHHQRMLVAALWGGHHGGHRRRKHHRSYVLKPLGKGLQWLGRAMQAGARAHAPRRAQGAASAPTPRHAPIPARQPTPAYHQPSQETPERWLGQAIAAALADSGATGVVIVVHHRSEGRPTQP